MSMKVFQPVGQKRLTNVAVVRYKKGGIRFEVACYKNKVVNWRNGTEKDLDEVLQSTTVFNNVSKAVLAKDKDLQNVFGTTDQEKICLIILQKGEFQVSDKERKLEYENLFKDIASILVDKCINPETGKPFTLSMLERALRDVHFNVDPKRSAKQQALEALPMLQQKFPIERARMRLMVLVPFSYEAEIREMLREQDADVQGSSLEGDMTAMSTATDGLQLICVVEPEGFRKIFNLVQKICGSEGSVQVLTTEAVESSTTLRPTGAPAVAEVRATELASADLDRLSMSQQAGAVPQQAKPAVPVKGQEEHAWEVVCPRGPVASLPEEHASRRERFQELDELQPGWTVELRARNGASTVDACFFDPEGQFYKSYATARRAALQHKKTSGTQ